MQSSEVPSRKRGGDAQDAATAWTLGWVEVRKLPRGLADFGRGSLSRLGRGQKLSDCGEPCTATAIGEEAIVADAMEPVRQAVDEEAADELVRIERHQPGCVAMTVVAPAEGYGGLVGADQAAIGDRDPVRVAAKIGKDMLG